MRSPAAPRAYYGDPESGTFRNGWVRMGDLGRIDAEGYLYLVDRESDVVKSGAYKVSTIHVEEAVYLSDEICVMGTRPGRIIEHIEVPIERPRPRQVVTSAGFTALKQHCLDLLHTPAADAAPKAA